MKSMRAHIRKILLFGALVAVIIYAVCALQSDTVTDTQYSSPQPWVKTSEGVIHEKPQSIAPISSKTDSLVKPEATAQKLGPTIAVSFSAGTYFVETNTPVGSSVYDLMGSLKTRGLTFDAKYFGSGMGYFITGINGKLNDEKNGTYWTLYVNGKESPLGASSYILKDRDSVSWKFENRLNQ
jgi:hypothetical protein